MRSYYRPLVEALDALPSRSQRQTEWGTYVEAPLVGLDATLGIDERVLRWYHEGRPNLFEVMRALDPRQSLLRHWEERSSLRELIYLPARPVGYDGVAIVLGNSWSPEYMLREPEERAR